MNTLIVIVGPTGVGKTALCLDIAERYSTDIINADSRQIFKGIPIGTAAPTAEEQRRVKHYFVGCLHINEYYNASMFENDVVDLLATLFADKDKVVMSGGSMMYIDAVCNGIDDIPTVDEDVRRRVQRDYEEQGLEVMLDRLAGLDPDYYAIVDRKNHKRVIHAVEICLSTGKPYTSFRTSAKKTRPFRIVKIGLHREREELYRRIDERVDRMMADGLLDEARRMYQHRTLNALNTVGYKELFAYFDGDCTLADAVAKIKSNTHKYCRKQLTWFKRDPSICWFAPEDIDGIMKYIEN